jgi:hypothetical protein
MLPLSWKLDLAGNGSQRRCRLKMRSETLINQNEGEKRGGEGEDAGCRMQDAG